MDSARRRAIGWQLGYLGVGLGAGAVAYGLGGGDGFWIDEVSSVAMARRAGEGVLHLTAWSAVADVHPPGFYLLLSAWGAVFGYGEGAARALPALLSAGAVFGTGRLGARAFRPAVGLWAAALLGLLPVVAHYGVELRAPALVLALTVAGADAVLGVLAAPTAPVAVGRRRAAWLALVLSAGLWADYGFALVAAALLGAAFLAGGGDARAQARLVGAGVVAAALFAPWLPALLFQARDLPAAMTAHVAHGPGLVDLLAALGPGGGFAGPALRRGAGLLWAGLTLGGAAVAALGLPRGRPEAPPRSEGGLAGALRSRPALAVALGAAVVGGFGPALLAAALPLPAAAADRFLEHAVWAAAAPAAAAAGLLALAALGLRFGPQRPGPARVLGLGLALLVLLAGLLQALRPFLLVRTALPALPFAAALVAGGLWRTGGWRTLTLGCAALAATAAASLAQGPPVPPRPDLRTTAAALSVSPAVSKGPAAGAAVLVLPRWELPGLLYYAPDLPAEGLDDPAAVTAAVTAALARHERVTLVLARREVERAPAILAGLERRLAGRGRLCADGAAQGFRWLTFCRSGAGG